MAALPIAQSFAQAPPRRRLVWIIQVSARARTMANQNSDFRLNRSGNLDSSLGRIDWYAHSQPLSLGHTLGD
jgi:hypothetical protein